MTKVLSYGAVKALSMQLQQQVASSNQLILHLRKEIEIQRTVIQQLRRLYDSTTKRNYDYCSHGHRYWRIRHESFNIVNNNFSLTKTKTPRNLEKSRHQKMKVPSLEKCRKK